MNKKLLWILCLALVLVIGVASVLYQNLQDEVDAGGLVAVEPTDPEHGEEELADAVENGETPENTEGSSTENVETTDAPHYSAPDFTVLDWNGEEHKLSDFVGKPVVLNFWASWCGPCKSEMPDFEEAYLRYGDDIHFLMVNCTVGDSMADAKALITENGYTFPVYFDTTDEASSLYNVTSIPMTFFIDAEGNLVTYARGALSAEWLQTGIEYIYPDA